MFLEIQEELTRRRSKKPANIKKAKTNHGRFTSKYALSERLVCGNCGCYFCRVTWNIHGRKQIGHIAERSKAMEAKAKEVMKLVSEENIT